MLVNRRAPLIEERVYVIHLTKRTLSFMLFHARLEHLLIPGVHLSVGIAEPDGEKAQDTANALYPAYRVMVLSEVRDVTELNATHLRVTAGVENIGVEGSQREMYPIATAAVQAAPAPYVPGKKHRKPEAVDAPDNLTLPTS